MKRDWYVLRVKPRMEKKVAKYLHIYGYFCHLPVYTKVTRVQRRKVRRELPLFPGYVFSKLYPEERLRMLQTNLLVATTYIPRPRETIHQLRQISRASKSNVELRKMSRLYKAGDYVRVTSGPMRNTEGYVKYDGGKATLVLNVNILGSSIELAISPENVEKIERKRV